MIDSVVHMVAYLDSWLDLMLSDNMLLDTMV
jgi:hypothetical protein